MLEKWTPEQQAAYNRAEKDRFIAAIGIQCTPELEKAVDDFWERAVDATWHEERFVELVQDHEAAKKLEQEPQVLEDMRAAYNGLLNTEQRQKMAKDLKSDREKFMTELVALEKEFRRSIARKTDREESIRRGVAKQLGAAASSVQSDEDLGTDKALALCDQILNEIAKEAK